MKGYQAGGQVERGVPLPAFVNRLFTGSPEPLPLPRSTQEAQFKAAGVTSRALDPIGALMEDTAKQAGAGPILSTLAGIGAPSPADIAKLATRKLASKGLRVVANRFGDLIVEGEKGLGKVTLRPNIAENTLDLLSISKGTGKSAKELREAAGQIAQGAGLDLRQGVTPLSEAGMQSIERALERGQLIRNPAGPGFISTGKDIPGFQRGGQVAGKATIRVPTRTLLQRFQTGGEVQNVIPDLFQGFQGLQANTGAQRGITQQLRGFSPFAGPTGGVAQGTLTNLLQTGLPTDVGGITDVAQARAGRTFQDLSGGINERLGALGLGSSSARTNALARAARDLSAQVGETGILSGVEAREAATGRQLASLSPFLGATGQGLGALSTAGGIAGNVAGQELQARSTGLSGGSGLAQSLLNPLQGELAQPPPGMLGGSASGGFFTGGGGTARPNYNRVGIARGLQAGGRVGGATSGRVGGAAGGRQDFGDYLSNLLFGRQFTRRQPEAKTPIQIRLPELPSAAAFGRPSLSTFVPQTPIRTQANFRRTGGGFGGGRSPWQLIQEGNPFGVIGPTGQLAPVQQWYRNSQTGELRPLSTAGAANFAGGGKIKGPSVPPDSVPILAQGGEGVLHVNLMSELEKSKSKDPLVRKMKKLMGFQAGGKIPTDVGNEFLSRLREAIGGTPIFGNEALANPPGAAGGFPGGTVSTLGVAPVEQTPTQMVAGRAQAARTRADLLAGLALQSPQGARIHQDAAQAEADAQAAEAEIAGIAQRETPVKQEVTRRVTPEEQEQTRVEAEQEEVKRIRTEADSILKAARAPLREGGRLNYAQAREDLEIRGIDPAMVFPGFEAAEQKQAQVEQQQQLASTVTGALQNAPGAGSESSLQAYEAALQGGANLSPEQVQEAGMLLQQFVEFQQGLGVPREEILARIQEMFPTLASQQ